MYTITQDQFSPPPDSAAPAWLTVIGAFPMFPVRLTAGFFINDFSARASMIRAALSLMLLCLMLFISGGCHRTAGPVTKNEPPTLPVSKPVQRTVTDFVEFTGRTVPVNSVDVRPRVTGY